MKSNKDLSIIVYSCLRNSDMWSVFSKLYKRYWPDSIYNLYLLTDDYDDKEGYAFDNVICIDANWAQMIKYAVERVDTPYVMLFMDDYLLNENINNEDIERQLEKIKEYDAVNIRFSHSDFSEYTELSPEYLRVIPGSAYSISLQPGIWDSSFLLRFINDTWSPWDFERKGSVIQIESGDILEVRNYKFPYTEGVRRGKWMPDGIKICSDNGIVPDYSKRPKMNFMDEFIMGIKGMILRLFPKTVLKMQAGGILDRKNRSNG